MRNRLIAAILGLFGAVTGVQAAPNVTSEITYDLANAGRIITSGMRSPHRR